MSDADREVALVASDMVVLTLRDDELHVALIRRAAATERGKWALPGGFMRRGESAEQAAYRELREEVGIAERDVVLEQLRTYTEVERDPRPERVIGVAWTVFGARLPDLEAASDALEAVWVPVDEALGMPLAFDHQRILADGVERALLRVVAAAVAGDPFAAIILDLQPHGVGRGDGAVRQFRRRPRRRSDDDVGAIHLARGVFGEQARSVRQGLHTARDDHAHPAVFRTRAPRRRSHRSRSNG